MASAVVGLVTLAVSTRNQRKARKDQKRANKIQERKASVENARARRRNVAASRIARAQTIAEGVNAGFSVGGNSSVTGSAGSITNQGASANAFSRQLEQFDRQRFSALNSANSASQRANNAEAIGGVAQSFLQPQS